MIKFLLGVYLGMFLMYCILSKYSINLTIKCTNPKDEPDEEDEEDD